MANDSIYRGEINTMGLKRHQIILAICLICVSALAYHRLTITPTSLQMTYTEAAANTNGKKVETEDYKSLLEPLNERCRALETFSCESISIKISDRFVGRANAKMWYEKDKNFRLLVGSVLGQEMDIGSNDRLFWFWSKRMNPRCTYFAAHEKIHRSRLKAPFEPNWLRGTLGFDPIDPKTPWMSVKEIPGYYRISHPVNTTQGRLWRIMLIDKSNNALTGTYLTKLDGTVIAFAEILEIQHVGRHIVPAKMRICWVAEAVEMHWTFDRPEVNRQIPLGKFDLPIEHPMQDMTLD